MAERVALHQAPARGPSKRRGRARGRCQRGRRGRWRRRRRWSRRGWRIAPVPQGVKQSRVSDESRWMGVWCEEERDEDGTEEEVFCLRDWVKCGEGGHSSWRRRERERRGER
eukprot:scaffold212773_cov26-Tisochrysis_lutea.AAC.2